MKPQHSLKKSSTKAPTERVVKDIRRQTRRHFSAEDKIRIVLDGLRGEDIQDQIIEMALEADATDLSPRELSVRFTDEKRYFVSKSTVYRLLKAHDLITSPAYVVIKAADAFHTKTTRPNEMWQTDFTYFKIIGWGWMYLSTVLDDFSWLTSSPGSCAPR